MIHKRNWQAMSDVSNKYHTRHVNISSGETEAVGCGCLPHRAIAHRTSLCRCSLTVLAPTSYKEKTGGVGVGMRLPFVCRSSCIFNKGTQRLTHLWSAVKAKQPGTASRLSYFVSGRGALANVQKGHWISHSSLHGGVVVANSNSNRNTLPLSAPQDAAAESHSVVPFAVALRWRFH